MRDHGQASAFERLQDVWSRRKWLGIVVFAVGLAAVVGIAKSLPNIYRSTATVLVERHYVPEAFVRSSVTGELETRLHTISQQILSRARLGDLITRLDLYQNLRKQAPLEAAVEKMQRDIQFELKGIDQASGRSATIAFNLSYRGRDPEIVAQVTNTLASFYVEENVKLREQQATSTTEFLRFQLAETKKRLADQEQRVRDFRGRHLGELPQQMGVNLATLERLHAQLHLNSANHLRALDRRGALAKQLAEAIPAGAVATPDATAAKIATLRQELLDLRRRFSDKYPDVLRVRAELSALERQLAEPRSETAATEPAGSGDPSVTRLKTSLHEADAELDTLKAEEQRLRRDITLYQQRVENAPQREQEFDELARDYETARELYASLLKRYEDAQLAESMEQRQKGEQFRLLDPALPAKDPAAPNRVRLLLLGLLLSLGLGAGAVLMVEYLDTSFHTADELRAWAQAPVLVSIPLILSKAETRRRKYRFAFTAVAVALALTLVFKASQYVADGNEVLVGLLTRASS